MKSKNYLDRIPLQSHTVLHCADENGIVTLKIKNKGLMNKAAQKFLGKPEESLIHLDEHASFVWQKIDGKKSIGEIASDVDGHFGKEAQPLYERLIQFFITLEKCKLIYYA